MVLASLKRLKEAHASAEQSIALESLEFAGHAARGLAFAREARWAEAEAAAREGRSRRTC
ncbi:MAG: hypothetical protein JSR82_14785 [Verrucomicrobia bacterium]|nr:hypothetical protein [Verrucomicrobiota bacterium]